ncbi:outer membrane protein [Yoonia algicola]|uniref:Outer membrane beta-barrel protein n=1 Tax=Yoonia algicola TaxID=3137368 RepID=A0AAN0M7T5_9RHOB
MKHHYSLAFVIGLFASPGFAGGLSDPIIPAPLPPALVEVPFDWYIGLQAGIGSGDVTPELVTTDFPAVDMEGPFYGLHAGVQRSFGAFTAGIELDYNTSNVDLEDSGTDVVVEVDTLAHLKLRAGGNLGPAFVYGTAGLAYADLVIEPLGAPLDLTDTAPFYGLGADVMVSQSISVGGEVLVHSFEDMDDSGVDVEFTTAMLRVSFHF